MGGVGWGGEVFFSEFHQHFLQLWGHTYTACQRYFMTVLMMNTALCSRESNHTSCHYNQRKLPKLSWPDHILAAETRGGEYTAASKGLVGQSSQSRYFSHTHLHWWHLAFAIRQRWALKTHLISCARMVHRIMDWQGWKRPLETT